jgi:ERCC4-type nuclease
MIIITDTREQLNLWKRCKRETLVVGDYTSELLKSSFSIERKSLADLYGSITRGHVRFRKMFIRADVYGIRCVLFVEGSKRSFINKRWPYGKKIKLTSDHINNIITGIERRWLDADGKPIEIVWCAGRRGMRKAIIERLKKEERKYKRFVFKNITT